MNTKKKRNRIILCLCSILVLIVSIFSFIPLNNDTRIVKADTVTSEYTFSGSNISSKTTFSKGLFSYNLFNINGNINADAGIYAMIGSNSVQNGSLISSSNSESSHGVGVKFSVEPGDVFTFSALPISFGTGDGAFINVLQIKDGEFFSQNPIATNTLGEYLTLKFTVDENVSLVYFTFITRFGTGAIFNDVQIVEGTQVLPYQPYQDSTQVNYEFDIISSYLSANGAPFSSVTANINGGIYAYVWPNDDLIHNSSISKYNVFITTSPNPNASTHYVNSFRFLKYNPTTNVLDSNYELYLYSTYDYVGEPTGNYYESNVSYVVLGSYLDYASYFNYTYVDESQTGFSIANSRYNFISYVDFNNRNFNIFIPLDSSDSSDYWQFRTYYLSSLNNSTSEQVYNSGYNKGYNTGYKDGEITGQQNGYNNGYKTGKNDGYNLGYNTALDNEKYSFTNLISSVIDVPVKAFTSLFNFEILGVNLSGFFLGLLTCCIVIGVIRLIL